LTCELAGSLVVQVMVAELLVRPEAATAEMVGAVASSTIVSVAAADQFPAHP